MTYFPPKYTKTDINQLTFTNTKETQRQLNNRCFTTTNDTVFIYNSPKDLKDNNSKPTEIISLKEFKLRSKKLLY